MKSKIKDLNQEIDHFLPFINSKVIKHSERPFKSHLLINTVKDVIEHPITGRPAYLFYEDDSYVECLQCKPVDKSNG